MKKLLWIASAILAAAAVSSCNEIQEEFKDLAPQEINFRAGIGQYTTKVTDNAFERGDTVGLFAGTPLNIVNEPLVWDSQKFVPSQKLYWGEGQTSKSKFRAYHPYNVELTTLDGKFVFPVKKDQSDRKDYVRSDLMFAQAEAAPQDGSVYLGFDHMLSKLVITVNNKSGAAIKDIYLAGLKTEAEIDGVEGKITQALGSAEDLLIPAAVSVAGTAADMYAIIVPPQTSSKFAVAILLDSGRTEVFYSQATMESGKQYRGTVEIPEQPVGEEIQFTVSVAPWEEGGSFHFKDPNASVERTGWRMVYYPVGMDRVMESMEQALPGAFKYHFEDWREGDQFFLLSDNDNYIFGCTLASPQQVWENNNTWPVENGGYFSLAGFEGELNVWFYPDEGTLKYEPVYPEWRSIGEGEVVQGINYAVYNDIPFVYRTDIYEDAAHPGVYMFSLRTNPDEEDYSTELVVNASNPDKVWFKKTYYYPGPNEYGDYEEPFYIESPVKENRLFDYDYEGYEYGYVQDGIVHLGYCLQTTVKEDYTSVYNLSNFQLVLPGYKRLPVVGLSYGNSYDTYEGDATYTHITLQPWQDVENMRYQVYPGVLSSYEFREESQALRNGAGTALEVNPGRKMDLALPIAKSGTYYILMYVDAPSVTDKWGTYARSFISVVNGEYPESVITLSNAKPHPVLPDKAIMVHLDFPNNVGRVFATAISKEAAEEAGLTEEDYYSYAYDNGWLSGQGNFFSGISGQDFVFTDLKPETEYIIIAAGWGNFSEKASWASVTVKTEPEPTSWENVGVGTWVDSTFMTGGYQKQVNILKAAGTERYRAEQPYSDFWTSDAFTALLQGEDSSRYEDSYIGYSTDFDFFFKEVDGVSYIYYATYRNGRVEPDFRKEGTEIGYLDFFHYNILEEHPDINSYVHYNKEVSAGVYNLAPYVKVHDTNYYYNWMSLSGELTLVMPGASYSPAPKAAVKANCVELMEDGPAVVTLSADHKAKPFKRHPINMGKAIVKTL
ncbi:MAG: fimbrillin family protein [Bacteroidales bacterium]|nr:fimbrillin family protein [Bacteroidales bacterium]